MYKWMVIKIELNGRSVLVIEGISGIGNAMQFSKWYSRRFGVVTGIRSYCAE